MKSFDLTDPKVRRLVKKADLVFGVDPRDGRPLLFFGRDYLEAIARSGESKTPFVATIRINLVSSDPKRLAAMCIKLKGRCDFDGDKDGALRN